MQKGKPTLPNLKCPECGLELPPGVPAYACPKCLLKAGLEAEIEHKVRSTIRVVPPLLDQCVMPQCGQTFDHYQILRELGRGGMGVVFEAEDLASNRRVALKVLSLAFDSPEARQRFHREGRLAGAINHPNSVYVFGCEEISGVPVIAMELVTGGTLGKRSKPKVLCPSPKPLMPCCKSSPAWKPPSPSASCIAM